MVVKIHCYIIIPQARTGTEVMYNAARSKGCSRWALLPVLMKQPPKNEKRRLYPFSLTWSSEGPFQTTHR